MTDLDDGFGSCAFEGGAVDHVLCVAGCSVALPLDDLPREDDAFEIKDREVVIFKFVRGVG